MQVQRQVLKVSDINRYIKDLLQRDGKMNSVLVQGEISNFTRHSSGHLYFSLKDSSGSIKCVMFRGNAQRLRFDPKHGMEVLIAGSVSVFERDGVYQLYVEQMMEAGAGALHAAYEKIKAKLEAEGLFDAGRKRSLPKYPKKIGIVTSPTGAAIRDMISILQRRDATVSIYLVPAIVQGAEGMESICRGLKRLYDMDMDLIITGRGGGSLEDLWCFNEEAVVRTIAESPVPIISAVGHETDFTLADFAADVRAATPSMAAELAVPVRSELQQNLEMQQLRLISGYRRLLEQKRRQLTYLENNPFMQHPERLLQQRQQTLDHNADRLRVQMERILETKKHQFEKNVEKLDALSPLHVLHRGYSVCENEMGQVIHNIQQVEPGSNVSVRLEHGRLFASVTGREEMNNG